MDSKLEARLEKIENRLDALWRATMKNSLEAEDRLSNDCSITFKEEDKGFEINKWYKATDNNYFLAFMTEYKGMKGNIGYGFDRNGEWRNWNRDITFGLYDCVLASEEEVKEALIKEAIKRGFKEGVRCYWEKENITHTELKGNFKYNQEGEYLCIGNKLIYHEGEWAKILPDEVVRGKTYYHNIYHNLKAVSIENTDKERFEAVVISEDKNCASEGFKIGKITECWLNEWTKV